MELKGRRGVRIVATFLLVPFWLVHCLGQTSPVAAQAQTRSAVGGKKQLLPPEVHYGLDDLPTPVQETREAILSAVKSGNVEDLRQAFELNELKPDLGREAGGDPVAYWKQISGDGQGREILAILGEVLEAGYVILPLGRDLENNRIYVWPYFAEFPLDKLTPSQEVELLRLVSPAAMKAMKASGRYAHWRISIGADGVWHSFHKQ
jgi:hypothetical protein